MPVISGHVVDGETDEPVEGIAVVARDTRGNLVARGTSDPAGAFALEVRDGLLEPLRRKGYGLELLVDAPGARPVRLTVDAPTEGHRLIAPRGVLPELRRPDAHGASVFGRIAHIDGTAIAGVQVQAFHRQVGGEVALACTSSGPDGRYHVIYQPPRGIGRPCLFVRVLAGEERLATSSLVVDAGPRVRLDVSVDDERYRRPSELERLAVAVGPEVESVDPAALTAEDVALLVRKSGLPREQVTAYVTARVIAARTGLPVDALYALVRVLGTALLPRLLGRRPARLKAALRHAADLNMVARDVDRRSDEIVAQLRRAGAILAASPSARGSLGRLLGTTKKACPEQRAAFVERYVAHDGPMRGFWAGLRADPAFGPEVTDDLRLSVQLGGLTHNHEPLVRHLRRGKLGRASDVAGRDAAAWLGVLNTEVDGEKIGAPATIVGDTEEERVRNYAELLATRSALAFPTATAREGLRGTDVLPGSSVVPFLDANPDFDLERTDPSAFLASEKVVLDGRWDRDALVKDLATLQRVTRIAPDEQIAEVVPALVRKGFDSAWSIGRLTPSSFVSAVSGALDEDTAKQTYRNAAVQVARAQAALTTMDPRLLGPVTTAFGNVSATTSANPTWKSLFGSLDSCACSHCRSVYSPAAYLADLLFWLEGARTTQADGAEKSAYAVLDARRPDLKRIELTCENTNTVLPYVDLVLEILEASVLNRAAAIADPADPAYTHVPQETTRTTDELLARPEHEQVAAYDHLATAAYPSALPFDLWDEIARIHLEHLGAPRYAMKEALRTDAATPDATLTAERLKLSPAARDLLTGADGRDASAYWGYAETDPAWLADLSIVSNLLRRGEIAYDELLDLLHSPFANPRALAITGSDCETDDMTVDGLDASDAGRMHRFLRLWRNRGWTMLELDKVLRALGASETDELTLQSLADVERLRELAPAPLLDTASWWADLDTFADRAARDQPVPPLYDRVFLDKRVWADPDASPFRLDTDRGEVDPAPLADGTLPTIDDVRAELQAALGIGADDLARLVDERVNDVDNRDRVLSTLDLTLANVSALYRHVSLAKALRLRIPDLLGIIRLTGSAPFADPASTVAFAERVRDVRASGFTFDELHYLLAHDAEAELRVGVADEDIGLVLLQLRDGLARIADEVVEQPDPTGAITAGLLALVLEPDAVTEVVAAMSSGVGISEVVALHLSEVPDLRAADLEAAAADARFDELQEALVPYLVELQSDALVVRELATFLGLEAAATEDLLLRAGALESLRAGAYLSGVADEVVENDDPVAFALLKRLWKGALVLVRLGVDIDEQVWLLDTGVVHGTDPLLDPTALPTAPTGGAADDWAAWERLVTLFGLRDRLPGGEPTLVELLDLLDAGDEELFRDELCRRTAWLREDVDAIGGAFGWTFPDAWRNGDALATLVDSMTLVKRTGATAAQVVDWATNAVDATRAEEIRLAAKARHDDTSWSKVARGLRDPLRNRQRDALVGWLVANGQSYETASDLYDDLLIDVEMDACMLTSRIKQAISSVQLFVHRAMMNLEPDVELTRDDRDQWQWRRNYRVWEAARKVLLYPENWLEPELRLDKTPFFAQLESELMQGELTVASVEKAYLRYLERLREVARVEVMGLYHQYEAGEGDEAAVDVLHVVARTRSVPHRYFYRQWVDGRAWTAWEPLEVDIEADHLLVLVHERRLMLFWPMIHEKQYERTITGERVGIPFFEIKLAWTERFDGEWSARRISGDAMSTKGAAVEAPSTPSLLLRPDTSDELTVTVMLPDGTPLGAFAIDTVTGGIATTSTPEAYDVVVPDTAAVYAMRLALLRSNRVATPLEVVDGSLDANGNLVGAGQEVTLLDQAIPEPPWNPALLPEFELPDPRFRYAHSHQYGTFASQSPFVLDLDDHTLFVRPVRRLDYPSWLNGDDADPGEIELPGKHTRPFDLPWKQDTFLPEIDWETPQPGIGDELDPVPEPDGAGRALRRSASATTNVDRARVAPAAASTLPELTTPGLQQSQALIEQSSFAVGDASSVLRTASDYVMALFYHPYLRSFVEQVRLDGVNGLLDPDPEGPAAFLVRQEVSEAFLNAYAPTDRVLEPRPRLEIEFEGGGAYVQYNWELFFHAPLLIATRLTQDRRFEDALRWLRFVFDPTDRSDPSDPLRFWRIKPFVREPDAPIADFLALTTGDPDHPEVAAAREAWDAQVAAWLDDPFDPHGIAALRTTAYQKAIFTKYLDVLIAWGDDLFRSDTIESLNEATQLYVTAAKLLGDRPDLLPPRVAPTPLTFADLLERIDAESERLLAAENLLFPSTSAADASGASTAAVLTNAYFGVPPNEKLLDYWDVVEDRLFKIRHCMNIEGVVRQLPLFEPPIDPGLLVRARAAGLDLASALSDMYAPLPHMRFQSMLQKAYALNQTVRGLGQTLLTVLEKRDAEALANLRADQEVAVLDAVRQVKKQAIDEAEEALASAERGRDSVQARLDHYESLKKLLPEEEAQGRQLRTANRMSLISQGISALASISFLIPKAVTGASGVASPVLTFSFGGDNLGEAATATRDATAWLATHFSQQANMSAITAGHKRREEEWDLQKATAKQDLAAAEKQIAAAQIRLAMANTDLEVHERQREHAKTVRAFMEDKYTNQALYEWMLGQLSTLYFRSYQLAYDVAKRAERAYRWELGRDDQTFVQFGYWDSLKKGLLAGDRLQHDLERMDASWLDQHRREYELTKHVSLAALDAAALVQLRTTGTCSFSVNEAQFDLDFPGHYFRRIRSVAVTIPSVTGPFAGAPARLTLSGSRIRVSTTEAVSYDTTVETEAVRVLSGAGESIAIGQGQADAGLFGMEREDRYLPFENQGAVSDWNLELTSAVPTFDRTTIADVVLTLRYTAREGGETLRSSAMQALADWYAGENAARVFSAKHDFPTEWNAFAYASGALLELPFTADHFPWFTRDHAVQTGAVTLVAVLSDAAAASSVAIGATAPDGTLDDAVMATGVFGEHPSKVVPASPGDPGTWKLAVTSPGDLPADWLDDVLVVVGYTASLPTA